MPSLLIVCSANQCRSPMAEALFKALLVEKNVNEPWRVESAGTWANEGAPATQFARQVMRERGLDIEDHRSQPVTGALLEAFDLVLVMEERHRAFIQTEFPDHADKVHLFSAIVDREYDIEDPVFGTIETYRATVDEMVDLLERGYARIREFMS
jgi:protein-tyrosine-phosphatase